MEIKSRIGEIIYFYSKTFHRSYENFLNKGVLGKELADLVKKEYPIKDQTNPYQACPAPIPYE